MYTSEEIEALETRLERAREVLIHCPHCGCSEIVYKGGLWIVNDYFYVPSNPDTSYDRYFAMCGKCGARTKEFKTPEEAVVAWNRRV